MRFSTIVLIALIGLFTVSSCGGGNDDVRKDARQSLGVDESDVPASQVPTTTLPTQPPSTVNTAAAAGGVSHYVCPNNCEGSGGNAQANCPVCGTQYVHNQAFHNQAQTQTNTTVTQTQPATTTSGPNAAGVWHYTCPQGCEGGSGSQGTCASCGAALAHNQAFHN